MHLRTAAKCAWLDGLACMYGWMDGEEWLGITSSMAAMPHGTQKIGHERKMASGQKHLM
jgi:hypothetical protein